MEQFTGSFKAGIVTDKFLNLEFVFTISQSKVVSYTRRPCKAGGRLLFSFNVKVDIFLYFIVLYF